jgi:hypothetical protein
VYLASPLDHSPIRPLKPPQAPFLLDSLPDIAYQPQDPPGGPFGPLIIVFGEAPFQRLPNRVAYPGSTGAS